MAEPRKRSDVLGKKMMMKEDDEERKKQNKNLGERHQNVPGKQIVMWRSPDGRHNASLVHKEEGNPGTAF